MDFWFVAVSALLLFSLDPVKASVNITSPNSTTTTVPTPPPCPSSVPRSSALRLGLLTVQWGPDCRGDVVLTRLDRNSTHPVCVSDFSRSRVKALLSGACEGRRGCRGDEELQSGQINPGGVDIIENDLNHALCLTLVLRCRAEEVRPPQEPVGFRVATALLCVALILLLLLGFCKPTVKALQKRLSNKRKSRWVGPTQSHSVSYHRGQTVKNLDGQKDSSYPALDRLVLGTREPSSNRNSYNL